MAPLYFSATLNHNYKNSYQSLTLFSLTKFHSLGNWLSLAFCNQFLSCFIRVWMFCRCCLRIRLLLVLLTTVCIWLCFIERGFVVVADIVAVDIIVAVVGVINKTTPMLWVTALWLVLYVFSWYLDCFIFYVVFWRFGSLISNCHFMTTKVSGWVMMTVRDLSYITFHYIVVIDYSYNFYWLTFIYLSNHAHQNSSGWSLINPLCIDVDSYKKVVDYCY